MKSHLLLIKLPALEKVLVLHPILLFATKVRRTLLLLEGLGWSQSHLHSSLTFFFFMKNSSRVVWCSIQLYQLKKGPRRRKRRRGFEFDSRESLMRLGTKMVLYARGTLSSLVLHPILRISIR